MPGIIVDRFDDYLVLQTATLAMDQRKDLIVEALRSVLGDLAIVERNDAAVRTAEGLPLQKGMLHGSTPDKPLLIQISDAAHQLTFEVDLLQGQKTGFYLDQVPNYFPVAQQAPGRRVLDCFTGQGGFALTCAQAGATDVTAVDGSTDSLQLARKNAEHNQVRVEWIERDVFEFLRAAEKAKAEYDLRSSHKIRPRFYPQQRHPHRMPAMRGYRELHVRAFNLLSKNGLLATFSCSHHVSEAVFLEMVAAALVDARRSARRLRRFEQRRSKSSRSSDHSGDGVFQRLLSRRRCRADKTDRTLHRR